MSCHLFMSQTKPKKPEPSEKIQSFNHHLKSQYLSEGTRHVNCQLPLQINCSKLLFGVAQAGRVVGFSMAVAKTLFWAFTTVRGEQLLALIVDIPHILNER